MLRMSLGLMAILAVLSAGLAGAAEKLVFGNQWHPFYKELVSEEPKLMPSDWRKRITIAPPPDDAFTREEVAAIVALKPLRGQYQAQIDKQIKDVAHPFIDSLVLNTEQAAALRAFWEKLLPDVARVTMHFKAKFDRARPRQYSKEIAPSIAPPGHPAYPSGHSTDSHTLALLLAEAWPEKKTQLLSIATQIAVNREIGGVHYRSDTSAGYLLAQQIFALLPESPDAISEIAALKSALAPD